MAPPAAKPAVAAQPAPAAAQGARVFLHYAAATPGAADLARRLADHLRANGIEVADIRPVDFAVRAGSIRYFFDGDREDARELTRGVSEFFAADPHEGPVELLDFTHYTPKPRAGNIEVWVPAS